MVDGLLRIGVTGHRRVADVDEAAAAVDRVLDELQGGRVLEVRSLLAEGADRIVTQQVMRRPGNRFIAVLPLEPDDYIRDFDEHASVVAFRQLLRDAARVEVTPADADASREAAYERAGHAVVESSDVLLALWDGGVSHGRGGTAEIVAFARARGVPVAVVAVRRTSVP